MARIASRIWAGVDAGSRTVKLVVIDSRGRQLASGLADQGLNQARIAHRLFEQVLRRARLAPRELAGVVATGYGRDAISFAQTTITEITCHARGVRHVAPGVRTVIDIGGQDSKLIRLDRDEKVRDFVMNDRCAAGTGRFLEIVAARLDVKADELGELARRAARPTPISHMCAVFAETEIIGLLASGKEPAAIAAGVQAAVAARIAAMAGRRTEPPVILTGGVALIPGMTRAVASALGCPVRAAPHPQFTGALGAALLAADMS